MIRVIVFFVHGFFIWIKGERGSVFNFSDWVLKREISEFVVGLEREIRVRYLFILRRRLIVRDKMVRIQKIWTELEVRQILED